MPADRPTRDEQIALMTGTEQRIQGYVQRRLNDPEIKAALHRYDSNCDEPLRKVAGG